MFKPLRKIFFGLLPAMYVLYTIAWWTNGKIPCTKSGNFMNATGHRFIIVLFPFFNKNCTLMVLQGNDVLSFYKELKYIVVKKWTFILLQGINHRTHHAVNRPEGNWQWVKSNVTFALCSSLSTWELQDLFQSETVRHWFFARGMASQDL